MRLHLKATIERNSPHPDWFGHKTVDVYDLTVDEKVAPIVKLLLDAGFQTLDSCQGDPGGRTLVCVKYDEKLKQLIPKKPRWLSITRESGIRSFWVHISCPHEKINDLLELLRAGQSN